MPSRDDAMSPHGPSQAMTCMHNKLQSKKVTPKQINSVHNKLCRALKRKSRQGQQVLRIGPCRGRTAFIIFAKEKGATGHNSVNQRNAKFLMTREKKESTQGSGSELGGWEDANVAKGKGKGKEQL